MKLKRRYISMAICCLLLVMVFANSPVSNAYALSGYYWNRYTITYYFHSSCNSRCEEYYQKAVDQWNSNMGYALAEGTSSNYNILCRQIPEANATWDGLAQYETNSYYYTRVTLYLNEEAFRTWNSDGALQSVAVHEFGHALGLGDNTGRKVMNGATWGDGSRFGDYGIKTPQYDDIEGVSYIFNNM